MVYVSSNVTHRSLPPTMPEAFMLGEVEREARREDRRASLSNRLAQ